MEVWIIMALFILGGAGALLGFLQKNFGVVVASSLVIIAAGGVLYADGYNSYVKCDDSGSCAEITTFTYDQNANLVRTDMNVFKMNANASKLSGNVGMGSIAIGVLLIVSALLLRSQVV